MDRKKPVKVLITGGGSEEPIDTVRSVCNFSTGRTSALLADFFYSGGFAVTLLTSVRGVKPQVAAEKDEGRFTLRTYRTYKELSDALCEECRAGAYDAVIHAAAVSDYSVATVIVDGKEYASGEISKVPSGLDLTIKMKRNPKLVEQIKKWCHDGSSDALLVAFKLTSKADDGERRAAVQKLFSALPERSLNPDAVVSNDLSEITATAHPCRVYRPDMSVAFDVPDVPTLASALYDLVLTHKGA